MLWMDVQQPRSRWGESWGFCGELKFKVYTSVRAARLYFKSFASGDRRYVRSLLTGTAHRIEAEQRTPTNQTWKSLLPTHDTFSAGSFGSTPTGTVRVGPARHIVIPPRCPTFAVRTPPLPAGQHVSCQRWWWWGICWWSQHSARWLEWRGYDGIPHTKGTLSWGIRYRAIPQTLAVLGSYWCVAPPTLQCFAPTTSHNFILLARYARVCCAHQAVCAPPTPPPSVCRGCSSMRSPPAPVFHLLYRQAIGLLLVNTGGVGVDTMTGVLPCAGGCAPLRVHECCLARWPDAHLDESVLLPEPPPPFSGVS